MPTPKQQGPRPVKLNKILDSYIAEVVDIALSSGNSMETAAKELGITRAYVYRRLKKYGFPQVPAIECWKLARDFEQKQLRLMALARFTNKTLLKQMEIYK